MKIVEALQKTYQQIFASADWPVVVSAHCRVVGLTRNFLGIHFPLTAYSPVISAEKAYHEQMNVSEITQQVDTSV